MTMTDIAPQSWGGKKRTTDRLQERISRVLGHAAELRPAAPSRANALEIAQTWAPENPVLCFAPDILCNRARRFLDEFPGQVTYAVKANSTAPVVTELAGSGVLGFDVASVPEMEIVRNISPAANLHYHNPIKSRREIETAYETHRVRHFALDDEEELEKIAECANPAETTLAVRFRLESTQAIHDFTTKFGATPEKAAKLLRKAAGWGYTPGLTFHPGSQCYHPDAYTRHIQESAKIALTAGVELENLNVGGGFPAEYPGADLPALGTFFEAIRRATLDSFGFHAPLLACEPGRAMVAPSMSLLVQIKHVRREAAEIFLSDGIYGALMELSQAPLTPPVRLLRVANALPSARKKPFTAYGPTCDPLDTLPAPLSLPEDTNAGDYLEFGFMGAYSSATATDFNGYGQIQIEPVRSVFDGHQDCG
ncbi:MAG: type III PLP-dependent enzyme [Hyphomicrobiales bacterium]